MLYLNFILIVPIPYAVSIRKRSKSTSPFFFEKALNSQIEHFVSIKKSLNLDFLASKYSELAFLSRAGANCKLSKKQKKILGETLLRELKERASSPEVFFNKPDKFLNRKNTLSPRASLSYSTSNLSYFTNRFYELLLSIIPDPALFRALDIESQLDVRDFLYSFMDVENDWKILVSKSAHNLSHLRASYKTQIEEFHWVIKDSFAKESTFKKTPAHEILEFYHGIISLFEKKEVFTESSDILNKLIESEPDFLNQLKGKLLSEFVLSIKPETIFLEIVKISLKRGYESSVLGEDAISLSKDSLSELDELKKNSKLRGSETAETAETAETFDLLVTGYDIRYTLYSWLPVFLLDHFFSVLYEKYFLRGVPNAHKKFKAEHTQLMCSKDYLVDYLLKDFRYRELFHKKNLFKSEWFFNIERVVHYFYENIKKVKSFVIFVASHSVRSQNNLNKKSVTDSKQYTKSVDVLVLNKLCDTSLCCAYHIPELVPLSFFTARNSSFQDMPPEKISKLLDFFIRTKKPNIVVNCEVKPESTFFETLTYTSSKPYKINEVYCDILEKRMRTSERDDSIVTDSHYSYLRHKSTLFQKGRYSKLDSHMFFLVNSFLNRRKIDNKEVTAMRAAGYPKVNLHNLFLYVWFARKVIKQDSSTAVSKVQLLKTYLRIASMYTGYDLFYHYTACYRGRVYPLTQAFSKVSGVFKFAVSDSVPLKLSTRGLYHLLFVFYNSNKSENIKASLEDSFANKKNLGFAELLDFFNANRLSVLELRSRSPYIETLSLWLDAFYSRYLKSDDPKKLALYFSMPVEIDQIASGPTLVALVVGHKKLAKYCGLIPFDSNEKPESLYEYALSQTESFVMKDEVLSELFLEDRKGIRPCIDLLSQDRALAKSVLMCFLYSEQHLNRFKRFKEAFETSYSHTLSEKQYEFLTKFASRYKFFIDFLFPNLSVQMRVLTDFVKEVVLLDPSQKIVVSSFDGVDFKWSFLNSYQSVRSYTDPLDKKSKTKTLELNQFSTPLSHDWKTKRLDLKQWIKSLAKESKTEILELKQFIKPLSQGSKPKILELTKFVKSLAKESKTEILELNSFVTSIFQRPQRAKKAKKDAKDFKINRFAYPTAKYTALRPELEKNPLEYVNKTISSFWPNFIHFTDGSLIRAFVQGMRDRVNYNIAHIHDCVLPHPNYVDVFFEVIKEVYLDPDFCDFAEKYLFRNYLTSEDPKVSSLAKEYLAKFNKVKGSFTMCKDTFDPKRCYKIEKL